MLVLRRTWRLWLLRRRRTLVLPTVLLVLVRGALLRLRLLLRERLGAEGLFLFRPADEELWTKKTTTTGVDS